jgi:flagellar motor switch protein FliM
MEKELNQQAIDAILQAARGGKAGAASGSSEVKPWDARQAGQIGREQVRSISLLHEGFARNLTHSLGAYLRIVFEAALTSAEGQPHPYRSNQGCWYTPTAGLAGG